LRYGNTNLYDSLDCHSKRIIDFTNLKKQMKNIKASYLDLSIRELLNYVNYIIQIKTGVDPEFVWTDYEGIDYYIRFKAHKNHSDLSIKKDFEKLQVRFKNYFYLDFEDFIFNIQTDPENLLVFLMEQNFICNEPISYRFVFDRRNSSAYFLFEDELKEIFHSYVTLSKVLVRN